jgi:Ca2+-binding RTX toxin-like protein
VISFEGNDTILGDDGDYLIEGNTGEDHLFGGPGADSIAGGEGRDSVNGGAGNDLLSSDRLDRSADFSRGGGETLIGAEGEDTIIFSNADQVSGGGDADTFHYVYRDVTSDPVVINDFDKDMDTLTLHYLPQTDGQGNPIVPSISFQIDTLIGETLIKLDGVLVAKLQGNVSISSADVILAEYDASFLDRL